MEDKIKIEDNKYYVNVAKVIYTTVVIDADEVSEEDILSYNQEKLSELFNNYHTYTGLEKGEYYDIV